MDCEGTEREYTNRGWHEIRKRNAIPTERGQNGNMCHRSYQLVGPRRNVMTNLTTQGTQKVSTNSTNSNTLRLMLSAPYLDLVASDQ